MASFVGSPTVILGRRAVRSHRPARRLVVSAATSLPDQYKTVSPSGDRVFVKVDAEETQSAGGLILPSTAQAKPNQGEVVAVGETTRVKIGDKVFYSKYAGTEVTIGESNHLLLKEADCIGLMKGDSYSDMEPLGDRVLIEVAEAEDVTTGGVLLTSDASPKPTLGKVVSVGAGLPDDKGKTRKVNVEMGSTVLYSQYSGTELEDGSKKYIVVQEADILGSLS